MKSHKSDIKFEDYEKMLWNIVHTKASRYSSIGSLDISTLKDDLFGEASLVYVRSLETWDKNGKSSFSTWLYTQVDYNLRNYLKRKVWSVVESEEMKDDGLEYFPDEDDSDVECISDSQSEVVFNLYQRSFNKWDFEKCAFLFFVAAFDESHEYNSFMIDFLYKHQEILKKEGFYLPLKNPNIDTVEILGDAHVFFFNYFKKDSKKYKKIQNNVKNSVKYFLSTSNY